MPGATTYSMYHYFSISAIRWLAFGNDFTEAKNSQWQLHQLGHMQICTTP